MNNSRHVYLLEITTSILLKVANKNKIITVREQYTKITKQKKILFVI